MLQLTVQMLNNIFSEHTMSFKFAIIDYGEGHGYSNTLEGP